MKISPVRHLLPLVMVGAVVIGGAYAAFGITMVEKALSALVMPIGLIWLALLVWVYFSVCLRQRSTAIIAGLCLAIIWTFGNFFVTNELVKSLERPFLEFDPATMEPLNVVVVLGGGTKTNPTAQVQLASSGERVATAAKLFLSGKTDRIICTGTQSFNSTKDDLDYCEEAKGILVALDIPTDSIDTIPGVNTFQEMQNLKKWLADHPETQRVGIVTSAWHLKRAMRLASSTGIEATPVPADFLTRYPNVSTGWIIPSAENLNYSSLAIKEYLAALVGR